ncbi:prolipoprotein diacylglyceryl transferase [Chitinivibrio alkaliphilus]|uniref:prolipoprotein diacylglyceryl transferase n=1 Tax=Chitinivibrio alkaliphilus TaxID=1505232 RepID=UPI0004239173|nr:prolipoprotein diacylglyceryl transferase [Chitinivibrio alkaliphilus]
MNQRSWWSSLPEQIDPTFITIGGENILTFGSSSGGGFPVQYYGLMYILVFLTTYALIGQLQKKEELSISPKQWEDIFFYGILGVILGGRLGYVLFYNFSYYATSPGEIFMPFRNGSFVGISGMSYHGGLIGAAVAIYYYTKRNNLSFHTISNNLAYAFPLGYTWGRLGNFINGELYGRVTDSPLGMYFPAAEGDHLRHPSQLYEAFFEGVFLFGVLHLFRKTNRFKEKMLPLYLIGYGLARFSIEFLREPDPHIGMNILNLSRGQTLSGAMILFGSILLFWYNRRQGTPLPTSSRRTT